MENSLIDIYNTNVDAGNHTFTLSMDKFPNTSAEQINSIYWQHGINVNVFMNWGFYTVNIK